MLPSTGHYLSVALKTLFYPVVLHSSRSEILFYLSLYIEPSAYGDIIAAQFMLVNNGVNKVIGLGSESFENPT